MSATIRGIQPLSFGTQVTTGYVTESVTEDDSGGQVLIEDEGGDVVTEITAFGLKTEASLEVIPKTAAVRPVQGDVFAYGPTGSQQKITVLSISAKRVKKDVEKWSIKGDRFPGVSLDD